MFFCSIIDILTITDCNYTNFLFHSIGTSFAISKLSAPFTMIKKRKRKPENAKVFWGLLIDLQLRKDR